MALTYRELQEQLAALTPEQLNQDVTVYVSGVDEYYPLVGDYPTNTATDSGTDQLDAGHFYLVI